MIIEVASKMGRTANSLAMKLSNFASLDPVHTARGVKGLQGASQQDRLLWSEFHQEIGRLAPESEQLLHDLFTKDPEKEVDFTSGVAAKVVNSLPIMPLGPTETETTVKIRRGQQFFRQAILAAYETTCCISGISMPELLVASHIKPWANFSSERLNLRNGLCLSSLHDAAFDRGLLTLDPDMRVVLSRSLRDHIDHKEWSGFFLPFEGRKISMPCKLAEPDPDAIQYHRTNIFLSE